MVVLVVLLVVVLVVLVVVELVVLVVLEVVVLVLVVLVVLVVVVEVVELELLAEVVTGLRGVKLIGTLSPAVPLELTRLAARSRVRVLLACITTTSMTTSDFGLSRSCKSFAARATASAEPRTTIAFCAV